MFMTLMLTSCSQSSSLLEDEPIENKAFLEIGRHLTVNLYDAQLYLLLEEFANDEKAQENMDAWLDRGRSNYQVSTEEEIVYNGQTYLVLTYTFQNENNPYARGVSAFAVRDNLAVCAELTCQEDFTEDLKTILTDFLENCTYNTD